MIYHALQLPVSSGGIDRRDVSLFQSICHVLTQIPDMDGLSCHSVSQFIQNRWGLKRVDGYFGSRGWEHSWNIFGHRRLILDAYPIGGVHPILVNIGCLRHIVIRPWRNVYIPTELDLSGRDGPSAKVVARRIEHELRMLNAAFRRG